MNSSVEIFEQVRKGHLTSAEGADLLVSARRRKPPQKPAWMPRALYALGLIFLTIIIPSLVTSRHQG